MGKDHKSKHKKEKKERKRKRSSSRSGSESNDEMFEKRLAEQREVKKAEKRRQKEEMKANETAEEKKQRRMEKKMRKDATRRDAEAEDSLIPPELNYTNLNNPFNDTKLTQTFVWGKKLEREGKSGMTQEEINRQTSQRIRKNLNEAAEFKRIRDSRAAAKEDMEMMKRDEDMRANQMSDSKERQFRLDQAKERNRIRIAQGRAKAIDLLARYSRFNDEEAEEDGKEQDFELENPTEYIKKTCRTADDLEDLLADIGTYQEMDQRKSQETWWTDIERIVEEELAKREAQASGKQPTSVEIDATNLLKEKSVDQLIKLGNDISDRMRGNTGSSQNREFWQILERQIKIRVARKRINEYHNKMLRLQLARIKDEQQKETQETSVSVPEVKMVKSEESEEVEEDEEEEGGEEEEEEDNEKLSKKVRRKVDVAVLDDPELDEQERERKWRALNDDQLNEVTLEIYRVNCYSPPYNNFDDTMPGIEILDAQSDMEFLMDQRARNRAARPSANPSGSSAPLAASGASQIDPKLMKIAMQGMDKDEGTFAVEEQLETQKHLWSDKYRPRKPTYMNRVQTGFEWNKYNQTHYDQDNPPPKIVQAYKFNIFYPDLLDHTRTPSFTVTPCDDRDFAVIRFKAGPPYEDIAFKVVNREWETLHKNGYKCQFQNGVFQLWFTFKKYRYRR